MLRYRRVIASLPPVYRWGKDVHCIVGVLGSLTTRYDTVITRNGEGWSLSCKNGTPRPLARLLCEINSASLTNKCLIAPAVCTVPDPHDQVLFTSSSSTTSHDEPGDINRYA